MEVQLEEEYEDKQKVLREKRELESKLTALSDQVSGDCGRGPGQLPARPDLRMGLLGVESWEHAGGGGCWALWSPLSSLVESSDNLTSYTQAFPIVWRDPGTSNAVAH